MSRHYDALIKVARLHGFLEYKVTNGDPDDVVTKALAIVYYELNNIFKEWKDSKEVE